jgi:AraC-like DNA-binding protein
VACDYLADQPERNVGLDELAAAAGVGKFRLIRLFRARTGLAPTRCNSRTVSGPLGA